MHAATRRGRHPQHRGHAQEGQPVPHPGQHVLAVAGGDQVPLVQHDHRRAARGPDPLGQPLVLVGGADGGVDDQQRDVGPLQGVEGAQHRVVLGPYSVRDGRRMPGRVDEAERPVGRLDHRVDGVPGGARQVVDDRPLLADQPVEQGGLAHVGPADQGHPWAPRGLPHRPVPVRELPPRSPEAVRRAAAGPPRRAGRRCPGRAGRSPARGRRGRARRTPRPPLPVRRRPPCWPPAGPGRRPAG